VLLLLLLLLSLVEERVRAEVEKCLLSGLELVSFFMKCRFKRRKVRLTLSTTNPSMSITFTKRETGFIKKHQVARYCVRYCFYHNWVMSINNISVFV